MARAVLLALLLVTACAVAAGQGRAGDPDGGGSGGVSPVRRNIQEPILQLSGRFYPGRTSAGLKLPQLMTWPGNAITVRFVSDEVSVELDGRMTAVPASDQWVTKTRNDLPSVLFQFDLDGEVSTAQITKAAPQLAWNRTGLSAGVHVLTVTRASEPRYGAVWLKDISIDSLGTFMTPLSPPKGIALNRRILFIGDSYTAGAGNTGDKSCKNANAANSNTLLAYGALAAKALKAEYQMLGWSVATLNIFREAADDTWDPALRRAFWPKVKDFWRRADALDPASQYSMASWQPQVVVMAAGTNDFANVSLSDEHKVVSGDLAKLPTMYDWVDAHEAFIREIASVYPSALIINLVFPLEQQVPNHCLPVEICLIQLRSRKPEDAQLCRAGLAARRTTAAAAGASVAVASAAVAAAAVATVAAAVATTGQALIIWPIATVTQLVGVRTLEQTLVYLQYFAASSTRFQAARLRNVYTLQLDGSRFPNTDWCANHPDADTHAMIADQVATFVKRILPQWAK